MLWLPNDRSKAIATTTTTKTKNFSEKEKNFFTEFVIGHCIQWLCTLHIYYHLLIIYDEWCGSFASKDKKQRFQFHLSVPHTHTHTMKSIFALIVFLSTYTIRLLSSSHRVQSCFFLHIINQIKMIEKTLTLTFNSKFGDGNDGNDAIAM